MNITLMRGVDPILAKTEIMRTLGMTNEVDELQYLYNLRDKFVNALEKWNKGINQPFVPLSSDEIDYLEEIGVNADYIFNINKPIDHNPISPVEIQDWDWQGDYTLTDHSNAVRAKSLRLILMYIDKRIENIDKPKNNLSGLNVRGDDRGMSYAFKEKEAQVSYIPYIIIAGLIGMLYFAKK